MFSKACFEVIYEIQHIPFNVDLIEQYNDCIFTKSGKKVLEIKVWETKKQVGSVYPITCFLENIGECTYSLDGQYDVHQQTNTANLHFVVNKPVKYKTYVSLWANGSVTFTPEPINSSVGLVDCKEVIFDSIPY